MYQSKWVKGVEVAKGQRECASRYDLIAGVVGRLHRPVTVLDLGANMGYFIFRLAEEFEGAFIAVEAEDWITGMAKANDSPKVSVLRKLLTTAEIQEMARCEHFDVILALNVLHYFHDWDPVVAALCTMGDYVIIETPLPNEPVGGLGNHNEIYAGLCDREKELLGYAPSHVHPDMKRPLWCFQRTRTSLPKHAFGREAHHGKPVISIISTEKKKTYKNTATKEERPWIPGINLLTFASLGGSYPSKGELKEKITLLVESLDYTHGDLVPWNFILRGTSPYVIDTVEPRDNKGENSAMLRSTFAHLGW